MSDVKFEYLRDTWYEMTRNPVSDNFSELLSNIKKDYKDKFGEEPTLTELSIARVVYRGQS